MINNFRENYCRVCSQFFCCKRCRLEHEQDNHDIHPECDICVYGKTYLRIPSESLLCHFKSTHWPLHCILCKKVFKSTQELKLHSTCPVAQKATNQENSNVLIQSSSMEPNYDSPPIITTMHKSILTSSNKLLGVKDDRALLTTSTPMQKTNEKELLKQIPEIITPVDYSDKMDTFDQIKSTEATRSNIKSVTNEQLKNTEPSLKRRVTFSEIEIINYQEFKHSNSNEEAEAEKDQNTTNKPISESSNVESEMYISAMEDTYDKSEIYTTVPEINLEESPNISITQDKTSSVDNLEPSHYHELNTSATIWESAFLDPDVDKSEDSSPSVNKNSDDLDVNMSVKNPDITDFQFFSSLTNQNFTQSDMQVTDMEETPLFENQNSTKIIEDPSSSSLKNLPEENQNSNTSNTSKTSKVSKLRSSDILSAIRKNLTELDNHSNDLIEILSPPVKEPSIAIESESLVLDTKDEELNNAFAIENQNLNNLGETLPSIVEFNFEPEISSSTINPNFSEQNCSFTKSIDLTNKDSEKQDNSPEENSKSTVINDLSSKFGKHLMATRISGTAAKTTSEEASQGSLSSDTTIQSGIWSSVSNALRTVVNGLSTSRGRKRTKKEETENSNESYRKSKSESDKSVDDSPLKKRIKLTDIQCRRTIRNIRPFYELGYGKGYGKKKIKTCDKATQTDL